MQMTANVQMQMTAKIGHFLHNFFTFYPNFFKPPRRVFFSLITFNSVTYYTLPESEVKISFISLSIYFTRPKTFWSNMGIFGGEIAHKSLITCLMIK